MNNIGKTKGKIGYATALFKIIIAASLLCWLFWTGKIDFSVLFDLNTGKFHFSIWYLSVLLVPASLCLLAYRWQQFLSLQQIHISFLTSLRLTLISNFFMVVLPGMIGGDIVKTVYICRNIKTRRLNAVSATLMDRVLGTYALFGVGTAASICLYFFRHSIGIEINDVIILTKVIFIPPLFFGATTIILAISLNRRIYDYIIKSLPERIPGIKYVAGILNAINKYGQHKRRLLYLIGVSALNHTLTIVVIMCVARAIHDALPALVGFFLDAIALVGNLVPITPGGIGITEGIFHYLYSIAGSDYGATIGLISRLLNYIVFVSLGFLSYVLTGFRVDIKLVEERDEIFS